MPTHLWPLIGWFVALALITDVIIKGIVRDNKGFRVNKSFQGRSDTTTQLNKDQLNRVTASINELIWEEFLILNNPDVVTRLFPATACGHRVFKSIVSSNLKPHYFCGSRTIDIATKLPWALNTTMCPKAEFNYKKARMKVRGLLEEHSRKHSPLSDTIFLCKMPPEV